MQEHLQSATAERITLYLNDEHYFTQFSKDDDGCRDFTDCVQDLANKDYCFYVLSASSKVRYTHIKALWQSAQDFSMVMAVLKRKGPKHTFIGNSLAGLLSTMDRT